MCGSDATLYQITLTTCYFLTAVDPREEKIMLCKENYYYYCYYFWAHQHKAADLKIKLSKIKMVATASYSVTIVLWKETAFPL